MTAAIGWRLFIRELQQGQLLLIILAITLAVLSVTGLASVSGRMQNAIAGEATKFIAADRVLSSPQAIDPTILAKADAANIKYVSNLQFNSMLFANDKLQLVTVRAVETGYPLKGQIELTSGAVDTIPAANSLWFEPRLVSLLGPTESVELGMAQFKLAESLARLPDGGFNPFASSPLVLMRLDDVAKTEIIQPGSRVTYLYHFVGTNADIEQFEQTIKPLLTTTQRWTSPQSGDSPIANAINRAEQFLLLASLLGIALACAAIGIAAQRYSERHYDVVAMLKTFGASAKQIRQIFALHLGLVTFVGVLLGLLGGVCLDFGLSFLLPTEMQQYPAPMLRPILLGIATGVISAIMFSAYPLLKLLSIPPLRVINRDLQGVTLGSWLHVLLSLLAMSILGYLYSGSFKLTVIVIAAVVLMALLLAIVGYFMINASKGIGLRTASPLQLALAGLRRRSRQNAIQLVGFSSALVLLLTIFALRQDLLNEWQAQLPEKSPNYFLVNISPSELSSITQFFNQHQIQSTDIYPVIRARLSMINGEQLISAEQEKQGEQGRVGISRELNLTWHDDLPANNAITQGQFNPSANSVSVESGIAERLDLELGDSLTFVIDQQAVTVVVDSIRQVQWESLQPNFFFIFNQQTLAPFAYTSMASFYLDNSQKDLVVDLIKQFPTVSVIDVGAIVTQLKQIVDQVSVALTLVMVLVLLASSLVMIAQTEAGMAVRRRELAVLRTFGATASLLKRATAYEFALLGAIAGLLAVIVAEFALYLLKTQIFELVVNWHWPWWILAPLLGAIIVASLGFVKCWQLLTLSCKELLQNH